MTTSESRTELMKPLVIKAAIPTVLSVAAYICAKIIWTRSNSQENLPQPEDESFHNGHNSTSPECPESEDQGGTSLQDGQESNLQGKLLELEIQVDDLQKGEGDLQARFSQYRRLKEKEFMLTEMRNLMMMEKTQAEFLLKEISLMEEENKRMGELVIEYTKLMQKIESLKLENGLLKRKAKKHWRIAKLRLRVSRRQKLDIEARNAELLRNREELGRRDNLIQELEDEVAQLKGAIDHLQREKIQLLNKLDLAEKLSKSSNPEVEIGVSMEDHEKVLKELEQLQKDRADEGKEMAYLKWSNACLRHELQRCHEQANREDSGHVSEPERESGEPRINGEMQDCNCSLSGYEDGHCLASGSRNSIATGHVHSRRGRLIQRFRRWVEGGKNEEKEKSEIRCFGTHSALQEADIDDDQFVHARNSCSSV